MKPSAGAAATPRGRSRLPSRTALGRVVGSAPLTWGYTAALLVTSAVLRYAPTGVTHELLESSTTDVAHLARDPAAVLLLSALWLPGGHWVPYAVVLLMVVVPLERRIGSLRAALVFSSGHVIATLLSELPIAAAILAGRLPPAAAHRIDVGASYGILALVAAFAGGLPRIQGLVVLGLSLLLVTGGSLFTPDMTMFGHALSLGIGLCWWPRLYHRPRWRGHPPHAPPTPD